MNHQPPEGPAFGTPQQPAEHSRVTLHHYWLRHGNRQTLVGFLALFDAIRDRLEIVERDYSGDDHDVPLWTQLENTLKRGIWSTEEYDLFHDGLTTRREILSRGQQVRDVASLQAMTLELCQLLHKVQGFSSWMIRPDREFEASARTRDND